MSKKIIAVAAMSLLIVSCAKRPSSIRPATIPMDAYTGMSCDEMNTTLQIEQSNLTTLSKAQADAAVGDAFGVFVIGVPIASVSGGDREGDIAVSKGKVEAMKAAKLKNSC